MVIQEYPQLTLFFNENVLLSIVCHKSQACADDYRSYKWVPHSHVWFMYINTCSVRRNVFIFILNFCYKFHLAMTVWRHSIKLCVNRYIFTVTFLSWWDSTSFTQSINPLACTECGDSLPFSGASSIPPCHTLFPAAPLRRPFFHPLSLHPAIYFLVYILVLLFPDSCTILFWESYFLPFSVHVQTNVIYAANLVRIFLVSRQLTFSSSKISLLFCVQKPSNRLFFRKKKISTHINRFISFCLGGPNFASIQKNGEVKERVELYLNSTSGHSWRVIEWLLPLPYLHISSSSSPVTC